MPKRYMDELAQLEKENRPKRQMNIKPSVGQELKETQEALEKIRQRIAGFYFAEKCERELYKFNECLEELGIIKNLSKEFRDSLSEKDRNELITLIAKLEESIREIQDKLMSDESPDASSESDSDFDGPEENAEEDAAAEQELRSITRHMVEGLSLNSHFQRRGAFSAPGKLVSEDLGQEEKSSLPFSAFSAFRPPLKP
jgi:hypothetical protein